MNQMYLILIFLLFRNSLAINDCNRCQCCEGGPSRCRFYDIYQDYCLDGCIDGFYNVRCTHACIANCRTCSNSQSCTNCINGYFEPYCYKCEENCLTCSNSLNCYTCKAGFYSGKLYDNYFKTYFNDCRYACKNTCKSCTSYYTCNECKDGYYNTEVNKECSNKCKKNCKSCISNEICTECIDGKFNGANRDCTESCNSGCISCTSYNYCTACETGKYGTTCQNDCGLGCIGHECDIKTGSCSCLSNFQGDKCDQCVTGKYGTNCEIDCPSGCAFPNCKPSGICYSCKTGFTGDKCNRCLDGIYGTDCNIPCPLNCAINVCKRDGDCYSCKAGFTGTKCDQCIEGKYGDECDQNCPSTCTACTSLNSCSVCKQGYWGISCKPCPQNCLNCSSETECSSCHAHYYGQICNAKCSLNCKDGGCDKTSGACLSCADGVYGTNCNQTCPENCAGSSCLKDGKCQSCSDGFFGASCDKICPLNCKTGAPCDMVNGKCSDCADGFYYNTFHANCSNRCKLNCKICKNNNWFCTSCTTGKFGQYFGRQYLHCGSNCPNNCLNISCDGITGYCDYGCVAGYWGNQCKTACSENCADQLCYANNGTCIYGCKEGYSGVQCKCPSNCICNQNGYCQACKANFENTDKRCTCSNRFCVDEACTSCSNSSFYIEKNNCCQCSSTCKDNECDSTAKCLHGCVEGYRGDSCLQMCKNIDKQCIKCTPDYTEYGGECLQCLSGYYLHINKKQCVACSEHCADNTCSSLNGNCMRGCIDGRWGDTCEKNCNSLCFRCDQFDGTCSVCKGGKYLSDCSVKCSNNCSTTNGVNLCAVSDGSCLNGCKTLTKYGTHCEKQCSSNCLNRTCNWKTGNCLDGCAGNFYGRFCDKKCNVNCLPGRDDKYCHEVTGNCINACKNGYYGDLCDQRCSENCVSKTCIRDSGDCFHGCLTGYTGSRCSLAAAQSGTNEDNMGVTIGAASGGGLFIVIIVVVIVVFLLLRKRHKKDASEKNDMTENNDNTTVMYSEIIATDPPVVQNETDVVYALPNKPKKSIDRVNSSKENAIKTVSNPNYERPSSKRGDIVDEADDCKPPIATKPAPVYNNDRHSVTTHKSMIHSDDTALEVEEDMDSITTSSKTKSFTLEDESNKQESDNSDTYYNVLAVKKRKIALDQLPDFVAKKTKSDFAEEFQQLPPGLIKPYVDSQRRANISKNRYKGIYPYDATRVVLKEGDSDYINASYIDGYNKRQAYIASIGPTYKYMGDMSAFWIMVWQEKVGMIVMLTNLEEGGAPKCDQYWPEKDFSLMYANIQVTCQSEETYADYTVRTFSIQKDSEKRNIVQVHFTAWPDKGTPDDVTSLIEFRQKVISTKTEQDGPIIVHCSAGIGRTGTYIALDSLTKEGETEGEVDIYACVRNMREQRVNMVQTAEQYQYLHNAVVHTLTFDSKAVEASNFAEYMTTHTDDHLRQKFERLQASVEQRSDDEKEAVKRNEALGNKNREGADIPGDRNRPKLYLDRKPGSSDYINAVYVNSYTTINRYLVTQTPLPDTVLDFLTLIVQEKVSCIVNMEIDASGDKTIGTYHPADNQTLKKGTFTVKSEREKSTDQYLLRTLKITHKGKSGTEEVSIPHIHFTHWNNNKNIPEEPAKFVQFIKDVELKYGGDKSKGPILVHCLTGAEKSGLFCVVSNLLEKTQIDQETSVVNTVRQIKYRRHMSIPNKDQYIFCHQCVNEYLRTFDIYSNFELKT